MSMFRRAMDYLGLGPDDAYDDYDASVAVERPAARPMRGQAPGPRRVQNYTEEQQYEDEYEDDYESAPPRSRGGSNPRATVGRAAPQRDDSSVQVRPSSGGGSTVRKLTQTTAEPVAIRPTRYEQAKEVADLLKSGQPVMMNIGAADADVAKRLIDFVSGVIYGVEGKIEKVSPGVFLLTPRGTRVIRD